VGFICFFIIVFKPFGFINIYIPLLYYYAIAFGISSFFSLAFVSFLLPFIFPKYFLKSTWNIGRQICFMLVFFTMFTLTNWAIYANFNIRHITGFSPIFIIGISLSLGITPSLLYILIIERQYLKTLQLAEGKNRLFENVDLDGDIQFYSSKKNLKYFYKSTQISCIKGCGNYFIVYFESNGIFQQQIIRNTLKSAEDQLAANQFVRCHKSYIVNSNSIEFVKGNFNNLKLRTTGLNFDIPVSRTLSKKEIQFLKSKAKDSLNIRQVN
jgi:hypothetical protein